MSAKTDAPSIEALLYHAQMEGILPITSRCNMACMFCSNAYNPKECEIFTIPPRSLEDIEDTILWLSGSRGPIVIGESVTRINEGEPLTHPHFVDILKTVRKAYPDRQIKITTNASLITPKLIDQLVALGRVEFMISLNTVGYREKVMGDKDPERTVSNVKSLSGKIPFEGSIVALPFVTGWQDIENTARFLMQSGASVVRLLAPGFTRNHPMNAQLQPGMWSEIRNFSKTLGEKLKIPVLSEPPGLNSLKLEVAYVLPGSPSKKAGLKQGDVLESIGGRQLFSRTEGFGMLRDSENPKVTYEREGVLYDAVLYKEKYVSPGVVMYDDLDSRAWFDWEQRAVPRRRNVLILTSSLAKPIIEAALSKRGLSAKVRAVESVFFGGNIQAGGLLVVQDFLEAYKASVSGGFSPDLVTLPRRSFDPWGRDLEGISYRSFEEKTGKTVILA